MLPPVRSPARARADRGPPAAEPGRRPRRAASSSCGAVRRSARPTPGRRGSSQSIAPPRRAVRLRLPRRGAGRWPRHTTGGWGPRWSLSIPMRRSAAAAAWSAASRRCRAARSAASTSTNSRLARMTAVSTDSAAAGAALPKPPTRRQFGGDNGVGAQPAWSQMHGPIVPHDRGIAGAIGGSRTRRRNRARMRDSPCRDAGLAVLRCGTHRVEMRDSPCRDAGLSGR